MKDLSEMQLPLSSKGENLEQLSIDKLLLFLHKNEFLCRRELDRDKGTDINVEIKNGNKNTGFVFAVQLKATGKAKNNNLTYSKQIEVSNLQRHLNNGPNSIYILYSALEDRFYFEWAWNVYKTLESENFNWQNQGSITIHFSKPLDSKTIASFHSELLDRFIFQRETQEKVIATTNATHKVMVNANQPVVISETEIVNFIEKYNFYFINEYLFDELINYANQLTKSTILSNPTISLVLAFAHYYVGEYFESLTLLKATKQRQNSLNELFKDYLNYLEPSLKYSIGILSKEEYFEAFKDLKNHDIQLYLEVETVRAHLLADPINNFQSFKDRIEKVIGKATKDSNVRTLAKCELIHYEGLKLNGDYLESIVKSNIAQATLDSERFKKVAALNVIARQQMWMESAFDLKGELEASNNRFNIGIFYLYFVEVQFHFSLISDAFGRATGIDVDGLNIIEQVNELLGYLDIATKTFQDIKHYHNLCAVLILRFEVLKYLNKKSEAEKTKDYFYHLASKYEFKDAVKEFERKETNNQYENFLKKLKPLIDLKAREKEANRIIQNIEKEEIQLVQNHEFISKDYSFIRLFPLGYFAIPNNKKQLFYEKMGLLDEKLISQLESMFTFVIPVLNVYRVEISFEGFGKGNLENLGIKSIENLAKVRQILFELGIYRYEPNFG